MVAAIPDTPPALIEAGGRIGDPGEVIIMSRIAASAVALALGLAAASSPAALAGPQDNTLRWASDTEPANIDVYYNSAREGVILGAHIWDTLVFRDSATGEYKMHLAESVRMVDATTVEVKMRPGIKAHDGEPVTAKDVAEMLAQLMRPDSRVVARNRIDWLKGATVVDELTVRLHLVGAFGPVMEYLAQQLAIYPSDYYARVGPEGMSRQPNGTGPYRAVEVSSGRQIVLERNPNYIHAARQQPSINRLVFRRIPEKNTQLAELMTGGLDWIWRVPVDSARQLRGRRGFRVVPADTVRFHYLAFDAAGRTGRDNNPMTNLKVRQAIAHAIDRQSMIRNLVGEGSTLIHASCHPSQFGCTQEGVTRYDYNPQRARQLLAEAGYPNGFEVTLDAYRERPWAEAIIGYLRAVGVRANLQWVQYDAFQKRQRGDQQRLGFASWGSTSLYDTAASTSVFFRMSADDMARDPEVARQLGIGDTVSDPERRKAAYAAALRRISEQAYWLPLFTFPLTYAFNDRLDFTPTPDELPRFETARWRQ